MAIPMSAELALAKDRKFENRRRRVLDRLFRQRWEIEHKAIATASRIHGRIVDIPQTIQRRRFQIVARINKVESMRGPVVDNG